MRGGAIAVRDREGGAGAQICVVSVQFRVVGRAEEIGGCQVAVGADAEPNHRFCQGGGGIRARAGIGGNAIPRGEQDLTGFVGNEPPTGLPDPALGNGVA